MLRNRIAILIGGLALLTLSLSIDFFYIILNSEARLSQLVDTDEPLEVSILESKTILGESYLHILDFARDGNMESADHWDISSKEFEAKLSEMESISRKAGLPLQLKEVEDSFREFRNTAEGVKALTIVQLESLAELNTGIEGIGRLISDEIKSAENKGRKIVAGRLDLLLKMKFSIDKTFENIDSYLSLRDQRLRVETSGSLTDFTRYLNELKKITPPSGKSNFQKEIGVKYAESALIAAEIIDREDERLAQLEGLKSYRIKLNDILAKELLPEIRSRLKQSKADVAEKSGAAKVLLLLTGTVCMLVVVLAFRLLKAIWATLGHLAIGVERISQGELDHRLKVEGEGELSGLAEAFNNMVASRKDAEEAMKISGEKYKNLFEHAYDGIIIFDPETRMILEANKVTMGRLGYSREELSSLKIDDIIHPEFDPDSDAPYQRMKGGESLIFERTHKSKDGSLTPVEISARSFSYNGQIVVQAVVRDISLRKEAEREHRLASYVYETAMEGVMVTDENAVIQFVNPAFSRITGYPAHEALGLKPNILKSALHDKEFYAEMWRSLVTDGTWRGEIWNKHKSGRIYPEWLNINAIRDSGGNVIQYAGVFHDITDLKRNEEQIRFQAYHDTLTGLPNRLLFKDRLKGAIDRAHREKNKVGVLFLDLDDFKNINDSLGHDIGDFVLKGIGVRLVSCLREMDTVARIGGDEFVAILEKIGSGEEASAAARRIIESLMAPFNTKGENLVCTTSVGISLYPDDGELADDLLKNADLAMYHAKELGKNQYQFFEKSMNERAVNRVQMERKLRDALENNRITCHYQPKMEISTGKIIGLEALARWIDEDKVISPAEFIRVAEDSNIISQMSELVLLKACQTMSDLRIAGFKDVKMAVNISFRLLERKQLVNMVVEALEKTGLPAYLLEIEFTESVVLKELGSAVEAMDELSAKGVSISIDDFGTGFSSLANLKKFPLDRLKIDRSFVSRMMFSQDDDAIVKAAISMGHDLGLKVIAEGVETREQLDYLTLLGCDEVQGYVVSRAVSSDQLLNILSEG